SSHLSFLRISHRTSGNFMLLNRTLRIEHGSSLMFDTCQIFTTTATFIRVDSGVTTVINGSALLLRNSTVGDPTFTYSTFHFADATTFSLGSVLLFENSNLMGGDSSLVTAMNGISFLTNSMFALFGNTLGRSSSLTGSYTLTVASNSSFVARTNNFALSSGGVAQSSITAPFLMEFSCMNTALAGMVDTSAKLATAGFSLTNMRMSTCNERCLLGTTCFPSLTSSFDDATCTCVCSPGGYGARCLPVDPPRTAASWQPTSWQRSNYGTYVFRDVSMPIEEINFRNGTSYTFINVTFGFQNVSFDLNQFDINTPTINIYFENCTMANTRLYFSGAPLLSRAFVAPVNITIRNSVMTNGGLIGFAYFFPVQSSILIDGLKLLSDVPSGGFSVPFQSDSDSSVSFGSFTAVDSTIIIRNSIINTTNRPILFVTSGLRNTSFMFVDSISYPGLIQTANAVILTSVVVLRSLIYGPTTTQIGVLPSLGGSAAAPAAVILEDSILFGSVYPYGITIPANGASFISRSIVDFTSMLSSSTQAFSNGAQYVLADSTVSQTQTFSSAPTGNFTNYVVQCSTRLGNTPIDSSMTNVATPQFVACTSQCTMTALCFLPYTASFDTTTCTCNCNSYGFGPRCMPFTPMEVSYNTPSQSASGSFTLSDTTVTSDVLLPSVQQLHTMTFLRVVFTGVKSGVRIALTRMQTGALVITFTDCTFLNGTQAVIYGEPVATKALRTATVTFLRCDFQNGILGFSRGFGNARILISSCIFNITSQQDMQQLSMPTNIASSTSPAIVLHGLTLQNSSLIFDNTTISSVEAAITAPHELIVQGGSLLAFRSCTVFALLSALRLTSVSISGSSTMSFESSAFGCGGSCVYIITTLTLSDFAQMIFFETTMTADTGRVLRVLTSATITGASVILLDRVVTSGASATTILNFASAAFTNMSYVQLHHVHAAQTALLSSSFDSSSFFVAQCVVAGGIDLDTVASVVAAGGPSTATVLPCTTCNNGNTELTTNPL
ncbi:DGF-1-like protein, putative, partial [Bodo saltans]